MVEKIFLEKLLEIETSIYVPTTLCKKHVFKGLFKNSRSMDLSDIENTLLKQ